MSDAESPNFEFVYAETQAVHHTVDGSFLEVRGVSNVEPEREREIIAEGFGIAPESLIAANDTRQSRGRRLSVGFSKWRSSWDPHASKIDPNLN